MIRTRFEKRLFKMGSLFVMYYTIFIKKFDQNDHNLLDKRTKMQVKLPYILLISFLH